MLWCFSQWHFIQFQLHKLRIRFKRLKFAFRVAIRFLFKIRCISLMASTVPGLDMRLSYWINGICGVCSKRSMEWASLCLMWIHVFSYQNNMSHWSVYGYMIRDGRPGEGGLYCKYPSAQLGISEANALFPPQGSSLRLDYIYAWLVRWTWHQDDRFTLECWRMHTNRGLFCLFETKLVASYVDLLGFVT